MERAKGLMSDWPSSRQQQKKFVLAYLANGFTNATSAAIEAGYSEKAANSTASKLVSGCGKYQHILPVIDELRKMFEDKNVELSLMTSIELQQFWASIIRGEIDDVKLVGTGEGIQEVMEVPADLMVKLQASDKYARTLGMYINKVDATVASEISITLGGYDDED